MRRDEPRLVGEVRKACFLRSKKPPQKKYLIFSSLKSIRRCHLFYTKGSSIITLIYKGEKMIEFKNIYKTFKTKETEVHALQDVSLTIEKGDIFGVIGFSGAGKSTLVRMVNALEIPTSGTVTVNGRNVSELKGTDLRKFVQTFLK